MAGRFAAIVGLALAASGGAALADPQGVTPVQLEEAVAVRPGTIELQAGSRYTLDRYNSAGDHLATFYPRVKVGVVGGLELDLAAPYRIGNQSGGNAGNGSVAVLYDFDNQTKYIPRLAARVSYLPSFGSGGDTQQYVVQGAATKWLGATERAPRLYLNLVWNHLAQRSSTQRTDWMEVAAAYSQLVGQHTAAVIGIVHGAKPSVGQNQTIVDVGLRREFGSSWLVSAGVGAGIGQQSPAFCPLLVLQKSFRVF